MLCEIVNTMKQLGDMDQGVKAGYIAGDIVVWYSEEREGENGIVYLHGMVLLGISIFEN